MSSYRIDAAAISNKGLLRENNEDNIYFNGTFMPLEKMDDGITLHAKDEHSTQIYAVCDGMGGVDGGEYASHAAVSTLRSYPFSSCKDVHEMLEEYCIDANNAVYHSADGKSGEKQNGSTFACVAIHKNAVLISHIGDSRVYRLHQNVFSQVTRDHSEVQRMVDLGFLTPEEAIHHPNRNMITRFLGVNPDEYCIEATFSTPYPLETGDCYLICSDGLSDMVDEEKIAEILRVETSSQNTCKALVDAAFAGGGKDNVSVIVLRILDAKGGSLFARLFSR